MKHLLLMTILLLSSVSAPVFAQQSGGDSYYEISYAYLDEVRRFSCDFVAETVKEYAAKSNEEIRVDIEDQLEITRQGISEATDLNVKRDLQLYADSLEQMKNEKAPKKFVVKTLEGLCKGIRAPIQATARTLSLANTSVFHAALFPFSSFFTFFKGVFGKREKKELGKRSDTLYRMLGPKRGVPIYLITSMAYTIPDLLFSFNPISLAINASSSLELITNYQCFNVNPKDQKKIKFCDRYDAIRDFFHKGSQKTFKWGKRLQVLLDKKVVEKRSKISLQKFCSFKNEKQIRRAKQALQRNSYFQDNPKVYSAQIILPVHKNKCTKLLIQAKNEAILEELKESMPSKIEGIEVVFELKGKYLAQFYYTQQELDQLPVEQKVCHDIEQNHFGTIAMDKVSAYVDFMKSTLAPSILGRPETVEEVLDNSRIVKGNVSFLRNIIFSIGPVADNYEHIEQLLEEKKMIVKQIKRSYKLLNKEKSYHACLNNIKKRQIDITKLRNAFKRIVEISSNEEVIKYQNMLTIKSFMKKQKRRLKLDWEFIPTNNLNDVVKATQSHEVGNIIVISHGKGSGYLVDSYGQEMPGSAFSEISPSLLSLNFYSCHSQKLVEKYHLAEKIKNSQSFYKIRYLTSVQENDFMHSDSFAPISAFGEYLYLLDQHLFYAKKGAQALQKTKSDELAEFRYQKQCSINIAEVKVANGSYSLALNKNYVGIINEKNDHELLSFPCRYLKEGENELTIKNMINSGGSHLESMDNFHILVDGQLVDDSDLKLGLSSFIKFRFQYSLSQ